MPERVTIQLSKPITSQGEELATVSLKEPNAGVMRKIKGNLATDMMDMCCQYITLCADLPPSSVNQIDARDLNSKFLPVFLDFFGDSPKTGEISAET